MALPVLGVDDGVRNGVSAVDHPIIPHINAHMGHAGGVIGPLEENKVPGAGIAAGNGGAGVEQPLGGCPAQAPTGMIYHPADETGAIKGCAGTASTPDIGVAQVLFRFGDHGGEASVAQGLACPAP